MPSKATIESLITICERAVEIGTQYKVGKKGELFYDALLFPVFDQVHGPARRQLPLKKRPSDLRARRIDFELRGGGRDRCGARGPVALSQPVAEPEPLGVGETDSASQGSDTLSGAPRLERVACSR